MKSIYCCNEEKKIGSTNQNSFFFILSKELIFYRALRSTEALFVNATSDHP